MPDVSIEHMQTPSSVTPADVKGVSEGGTIPATAAIGNAVADAVPEIAHGILDVPLSPAKPHSLLSRAGLSR